MIYFIVLTLAANQVAIIWEAYCDTQLQKSGKSPKHGQSAFFRGLAWALVGAGINYGVWGMAVLYAILLATQFYLSFDYFKNHFAGALWYYGNDGFFDSLIAGRENRYKELAIRVALVAVAGFIYFNLYEHIYHK